MSPLRALAVAAFVLCAGAPSSVLAQAPDDGEGLSWSVVNRFRLFRDRADFERLEKAHRGVTILEAERRLSQETGGRGWALDLAPERLCYDVNKGRVIEDCRRDGVRETYFNAVSTAVSFSYRPPSSFVDGRCVWTAGAQTLAQPCDRPFETRARRDAPAPVSVVATARGGETARASATPVVRDVLIVGLGDSIASGEGNPEQTIRLSDAGLCFRRLFDLRSRDVFYAPSRLGAQVTLDCAQQDDDADSELANFQKVRARWLWNPCHRSLYSYQTRAALALAIADTQSIVTYLPLACSGATIAEGVLGSMTSREFLLPNGARAPRDVEAQSSELRNYLSASGRKPDLILLTIGANDVDFSQLVANVMITAQRERDFATRAKMIGSPEASQRKLEAVLAPSFVSLRRELARFVGADLSRVIYSVYGNPAQQAGAACPSGRTGFDIHPAFAIDGARLAPTVRFVETRMIPRLRELATCANGACPATQAMTYVDQHRAAFAEHGFCAASDDDPAFDRDCFKNGGSFGSMAAALTCSRSVDEFRAYAPRARWTRTANDSYFAAMTYPANAGVSPADIHDAVWGLTSAVYGGAIHPTAEGHAAMADATLAAMRARLAASR